MNDSIRQKIRLVGPAALLALLCVAVYWPILSFGFVWWDDGISILRNPLVTEAWSWDILARCFTSDQALRFKPVNWLLFRLIHDAFGVEPRAWHAFGLILHVGAAVLFFSVLRQVLRARFSTIPILAGWGAWFGAALWAVHPMRAEGVSWCTASSYPLTAVFLLGSFWCYLEASLINRSHAPIERGWLLASWILAVLGYASYPVGVTYGLWLMVADRWLLRIGPRPNEAAGVTIQSGWWVKHAVFLAPAAIALVLTLWTRILRPGIFSAAPSIDTVGLPERALMAMAALGYYAKTFVWPAALTPNMPAMALSDRNVILIIALASAALFALGYAWRVRLQKKSAALVIFGIAALAIPTLGLTEELKWPVDRYSYLAHLPLCGAAIALAAYAGKLRRRAVVTCLIAGILVLTSASFMTRRQIMIWQDSDSLFASMVQHPRFAEIPGQAAHIYILWGYEKRETGHEERGVELSLEARSILMRAIEDALGRGDLSEAITLTSYFETHFVITPEMAREKGAWLLQLGRGREALIVLQNARQSLVDDDRLTALLHEALAQGSRAQ